MDDMGKSPLSGRAGQKGTEKSAKPSFLPSEEAGIIRELRQSLVQWLREHRIEAALIDGIGYVEGLSSEQRNLVIKYCLSTAALVQQEQRLREKLGSTRQESV